MTANRRTRITIESERVLLVSREQSTRGWCESCGREVDLSRRAHTGGVLDAVSVRRSEPGLNGLHVQGARNRVVGYLKSVLCLLKSPWGW